MGNVDVSKAPGYNDDKIRQAIDKALTMIGGVIESAAKEALTANKSVDTGLLRNSVTYALGGEYPAIGKYEGNDDGQRITGEYTVQAPQDANGEHTLYVGTNVEYAPYVELGHGQEPGRFVPALGKRLKASSVAAKPFLRPAAEASREKIEKAFEVAFRDIR